MARFLIHDRDEFLPVCLYEITANGLELPKTTQGTYIRNPLEYTIGFYKGERLVEVVADISHKTFECKKFVIYTQPKVPRFMFAFRDRKTGNYPIFSSHNSAPCVILSDMHVVETMTRLGIHNVEYTVRVTEKGCEDCLVGEADVDWEHVAKFDMVPTNKFRIELGDEEMPKCAKCGRYLSCECRD